MKKNIVIFENIFEHYELIVKSLTPEKGELFPHNAKDLNSSRTDFYNFVDAVHNFIAEAKKDDGSHKFEDELVAIMPQNPQIFLLDLGLLTPIVKTIELDDSGCIIRERFIKKNFPEVPVVWVSQYEQPILQMCGCFEENDRYVDKELLKIFEDTPVRILDNYI